MKEHNLREDAASENNMFYSLFKIFFFVLFKVFHRIKVVGAENVPMTGPVILAANHVSNWDPLIVGSSAPRQLVFLAKASLFKIPLVGLVMRGWGATPVERGHSHQTSIKQWVAALKQGKALGIFPEGKRNREHTDRMLKLQSGLAMLATKTGAPIVPVAVINSDRLFRSFKQLKVIMGAPIVFQDQPQLDRKEIYEQINDRITKEIMELKSHNA